MNLNSLTDHELHQTNCSLASRSRELDAQILEHLRETERRRLYAKRGFPSLFEYLTAELKYCNASAQLRIDAMRFSREVPEVQDAIRDGRVALSTIATLQKFIRAEKKAGKSYSVEEKSTLFQKAQGKSRHETEKMLAEISPESVLPKELLRAIDGENTEVKFVLNSQMSVMLARLQELMPGASLAEIFEKAMRLAIHKIDPELKIREKEKPVSTSPGEVEIALRPYIPVAVRRKVLQQSDFQCTYVSHSSGRRCARKGCLQLEHKIPYSKGGNSMPENLTVLCAEHNRLRAIEEYGVKKMANYMRA